ncbi:MAG: hypothetical protein FJ148_13640 [Deltaproteobacteria bacterium]|nr:hypothetical protein [Deltaproteobacteria bacterium]
MIPIRHRTHARVLLATALLAVLGVGRGAGAQSTITVPDVRGDQLLFVYDARPPRTSFLLVSNPGDAPLTVELALYPASLAGRLGATTIALAAAGHVVIDPGNLAGGAAAGTAGLAVVTPIAADGNPTPVVPPVPLTGSFTLANTALASAFGENAFGRLAVTSGGARAAAGSTVDGGSIRYQRIAPAVLTIPVYFSPPTLGPVENDGNRVLLAAFADRYDGGFALAAADAAVDAVFFDGGGVRVAERSATVRGVLLSDLQSVAGPDRTLSSSGKAFFAIDAPGASVLGVYSQSLGTFASGHRMASAPAVPEGTAVPAGCAHVDVTATVGWNTGAFPQVSGTVVRIEYAASLASLPGTGATDTVRARVTNLTGIADGLLEATDRPRPGSTSDDQASVALLSLGAPITPGPFARIRFDCVAGAAQPTAGDFSCSAEAATLDGSPVSPASCTLAVQSVK